MDLFKELKRFFRDESRFIFLITIILTILFVSVLTVAQSIRAPQIPEVDGLAQDTYQYNFHFYVEEEGGREFANPSLIFENIILEGYVEELENKGIPLILEDDEEQIEEELDIFEMDYMFNISRNSNSGLMTLESINFSQSNSLQVAEYFYDVIGNQELEILSNKNVFLLGEPYPVENGEISDVPQAGSNNRMQLIQSIIISIVFAFIIGVGISLLRVLFSKKLKYSFTYNAENLLLVQLNEKDNEQVINIFNAAENILIEDITNTGLKYSQTNLIDNLNKNHEQLSNSKKDLLVVIEPYKTSRAWYNKQMDEINWLNLDYKIIQINRD